MQNKLKDSSYPAQWLADLRVELLYTLLPPYRAGERMAALEAAALILACIENPGMAGCLPPCHGVRQRLEAVLRVLLERGVLDGDPPEQYRPYLLDAIAMLYTRVKPRRVYAKSNH